jgi:prepilin-type N-terminal cleavage/methylation domain-containing protein
MRQNRGLTLLELIVVVTILAVLAALIVSQFADMTRPAENAANATNLGGVLQAIEQFNVLKKAYPDKMDSLMGTDGVTPYANLGKDLLSSSGKQRLTTTTVADDATAGEYYFTSLKKCVKTVFDHDDTGDPDPSDSAVVARTLTSGCTVAMLNPSSTEGLARIKAIFGNDMTALPTGTKLVVFGVGPSNEAIGVTMASAPLYPHMDQGAGAIYRRNLAVYAIYADGTPGRLKAILDCKGDTLDKAVKKYTEEMATNQK